MLPATKSTSWGPYHIAGPGRVLIISDVHIPYHDPFALKTLLRYCMGKRITHVLLNGDIADFYAISRWETDPLKRDFAGELASVRKFLGLLRQSFPNAKLIYKQGNHEERLESYFRRKAPEVIGVRDFEMRSLLNFAQWSVVEVRDKKPIRLGRLLTAIHGHEYNFAISNPVNPARGFFLRGKGHVLGSHFHQSSQHTERSIDQKLIGAWSLGCLCDLHPEYRPLNNWNHGFAIVDISKSGGFQVHNHVIIDGKVL